MGDDGWMRDKWPDDGSGSLRILNRRITEGTPTSYYNIKPAQVCSASVSAKCQNHLVSDFVLVMSSAI